MRHEQCADALFHSRLNVCISLDEAALLQAGQDTSLCQAVHVLCSTQSCASADSGSTCMMIAILVTQGTDFDKVKLRRVTDRDVQLRMQAEAYSVAAPPSGIHAPGATSADVQRTFMRGMMPSSLCKGCMHQDIMQNLQLRPIVRLEGHAVYVSTDAHLRRPTTLIHAPLRV